MKVWQIATGEPGRDYRKLFFDHDIMILGPSHLGNALSGSYFDSISNSSGSQVHNFAFQPKPGDRVLMRFAKEVIGVGEIPNGDENQYSFKPVFRCVYGWDLCHSRRVKWAELSDLGSLANGYASVKQKPSFTQVHETTIVEAVHALPAEKFTGALKVLPAIDASPYQDEELGVALFRAGISNKNIEDILLALKQAERLCSWYLSRNSGRFPTENEVVSHIVLPLFLGLGWSHQQIAVEWNRVDMAFFRQTPTTADNCVMVLEAKGLGQALSTVLDQPRSYVTSLTLDKVRKIVVTDGANFFVYDRSDQGWNPSPKGYISVTSLQKEYVLPRGTNLVETLVGLQPGVV